MRVAYTIEHLWGRVPGGTGVATLEVARELCTNATFRDRVELVGLAGTHVDGPPGDWALPPGMPVAAQRGSGARLYAQWVWAARPLAERTAAVHEIDVVHATGLIPCPTRRPLVVTVHDLAFLHMPDAFTRWGTRLFTRSIEVIKRRAELVLCCSTATMDDCERVGISRERLRLVPLGVRPVGVRPPRPTDVPERYALFVGTVEPRKNLVRLIAAMRRLEEPLALLVVGPRGWGDVAAAVPEQEGVDVRFLGPKSRTELDALYANAAMFCYPSLWEGFGLPVVEAMAWGTPVVTSLATSCEEVAGGAAVLVDPNDEDDIARGITEALRDHVRLRSAGLKRSDMLTWERSAALTLDAYLDVAAAGPRRGRA